MLMRSSAFYVAALVFVLILPVSALAAPIIIYADRPPPATPMSVYDGDYLYLTAGPSSSYCCEAVSYSGLVYFTASTVSVYHADGSLTVAGVYRGIEPPALLQNRGRICFVTPVFDGVGAAVLSLTAGGAPLTDVLLHCRETTLYGGFNTSVTDFNFLELTNTQYAGQNIAGTVTAKNVVPTPNVTVIDHVGFSVSGDSRVDFDVHQRSGPGAFGPLRVAHDGAPGGLKAALTQYNVVTTTPFVFAPVAQEVLRTRTEIAGPTPQ